MKPSEFPLGRKLWYEISKLFAEKGLSYEQLLSLLYAGSHSNYLVRHRASIINARVRIFAWIFALLVLAWIPIDVMFLPRQLALQIAGMRLLVTVSFVLLAWSVNGQNKWEHERLRLSVLIMVPLLFYLGVEWVAHDVSVDGGGQILLNIYYMVPFLVVVGLAIFPLTAVESVAYGGLGLMVMSLGTYLSPLFDVQIFVSVAWILLLVFAICLIAATTQLNYMGALIRRISFDQLTGAFSRNSGQEMLDLYFLLSVEQGSPLTIAFLDLDHFKAINDNHGHEAGDRALQGVVDTLRHILRRDDYIIRWGGEEFLLLLPGTDIDGFMTVLSRITNEWFGTRPDGTPLTASIGSAERIVDNRDDWFDLVQLADRRMYLAKQQGRACAVTEGS